MEKMQRILRLFSYIKLKCNPTNVASSRVEMAKKNSCKFNHAEKRTLPEERGPHYQRKQSTDDSYFYLSLGSMFNNIFQILFFIRKIGHSLDTISSIAHRKIEKKKNVFTLIFFVWVCVAQKCADWDHYNKIYLCNAFDFIKGWLDHNSNVMG